MKSGQMAALDVDASQIGFLQQQEAGGNQVSVSARGYGFHYTS